MKKRVFLIVLDSYGIGYEPDADEYGDRGSNTLKTIASSEYYDTPNMARIGLFNIDGVNALAAVKEPIGAYGRMQEKSKGKDTTVGHWEIAGLVSETPFPTYPNGFPEEILEIFKEKTGRGVLCNLPYSGTDVIRDYGKQHVETGDLIIYTSADSVFQIAAHEDIVPVEQLYEYCKTARELFIGEHGVGRVIARPFTGTYPDYTRTPRRHDYALMPLKDTFLDVLENKGYDTIGIGKIYDIFAGKGIQETTPTANNDMGIEILKEYQNKVFNGVCFLNLVDFDMVYGHRNNIAGYAKAATKFDAALGEFMKNMREEDILIITADHGCDPGYKGTDHTREYTPMLAYGARIKAGVNLGTRASFADIGKTILEIFDIDAQIDGTGFWKDIRNESVIRNERYFRGL